MTAAELDEIFCRLNFGQTWII